MPCDHIPLEHLGALPVALDDAYMDAHRVTGAEVRMIVSKTSLVDKIGAAHGDPTPVIGVTTNTAG